MPRTTGSKDLPRSVRREIALDALRGASPAEIAREHDIHLTAVTRLRNEALRDPEGALEEAREELEFRLEVLEILGLV